MPNSDEQMPRQDQVFGDFDDDDFDYEFDDDFEEETEPEIGETEAVDEDNSTSPHSSPADEKRSPEEAG